MVYNLIKLYGENSLQSSYADTVGITTFDSTEQQGFITYLPDATSAVVTEEINGQFDLVMSYPVTGDGYSELEINRIIACKPNPYSAIQGFRIYKISKPLDGIVEVTANHISYDLNGYLLNPFTTSGTPNTVIKEIGRNSATSCPFEFSSDVNKSVSKFSISTPKSIREVLGGNLSNELSLIQTCSGEFEFDNLSVALKEHRGSDNGVRISYGKNLTEFRFDEDSTPFYTGVYPYWSTTKKPETESSTTRSTTLTASSGGTQTFTATAQYGNMNLFLDVSIDSGGIATWNLYFKIVVAGGYHFRYQNFCEVVIGGVKVFSTANIGEIDIHGLSVGSTVPLSSGTTRHSVVLAGTKSVPVSATFIQRQDLRGTWKISGNYTYDGTGIEVVTNVDTDDIYYCVTLDGTDKIHNYSTNSKTKKLYTLDLSKEIEMPKDSKGNYIYPDNTAAGQQARANIRSQLNTAFQKYLSENEDPTVFSDSLEVSFVDLAQSDEYADYVGLETVSIGDIVTVEFPAYNVSKAKECVKTEYNVLSDSYNNLTLGELTDTLASTIQNGTSLAQRNTVNAEQLKNAVNQNFNHINALTIDVGTIQADYIVVNSRLTATEADIGSLTADYGSFKTLTASNFSAVNASIGSLSAAFGSFQTLTASNFSAVNATISSLSADYGSFKTLTASNFSAVNATISSLSADYGSFKTLTASNFTAIYASISSLTADFGSFKDLTASNFTAVNATIENLSAVYADISFARIGSAAINNLVVNSTFAGWMSIHYAQVDFANISTAAISNLFAKSAFVNNLNARYADISFARVESIDAQTLVLKTGYIEEVTISGATVTNLASIVNLNADYINAGTLNADRIRLRGADGLYYLLNISADGSVIPTDPVEKAKLEGGIDGTIIIAQSITANKISVTDLSAFNATIANLVLESGSIHTVSKTSPDNTTTGIFISSTSFAIGGSRHYLRYWKDTDDNTWKLEIKGLITANEGSIAGWTIGDKVLSKETTTDPTIVTSQTQYQAGMGAPSNPGSSNRAFFLRSRMTEDGGQNYSAWDDLFAVFYNGKMIAKNADIEGKITAAEGKIGGWTIGATTLSGTNGSSGATEGYIQYTAIQQVPASFDPTDYAYAVRQRTYENGAWTSWNYQFIVRYNGELIAKNAKIEGKVTATTLTLGTDATIPYSKIDGAPDVTVYIAKDGQIGTAPSDAPTPSGSKGFKVTSDGLLIANNGVFYGTIYASAGTIGGWDISSSILDKYSNGKPEGTAADGTITRRMYLQPGGTNAIGLIEWTYSTASSSWVRSNKFVLSWAGKLTAIDAVITGKITADEGYIGGTGGWVIGTGKIYKGTAGSSKGIFLDATAGTTATIAGASHANLMIGVGANFGVDKDGCLFGTNVSISGTITATSGSFTGTVTSSNATITGGSITIGTNANTKTVITSTGATIGGIRIARDGDYVPSGSSTTYSNVILTWTYNSVTYRAYVNGTYLRVVTGT